MGAFDPGYIMSDWQMGNYKSMNESQIQTFLKSKNSCYDTNIGKYTVGDKVGYFSEASPPRTWHIKDGHFVCMADEVFNGGTAAHIIWQAAQDYKINPQVLLVLLEKEQSLVTDTFPHSQQYRSATGYGCPDTAPCSSKYYGLKNQIRKAAELFRTVLDGGWTNYPLGWNYVQYNPNTACGGTWVNIRSLATSALYRYTPYQPNVAALEGWNDGCGAYGNKNFYQLFEDWFGGIKNVEKTPADYINDVYVSYGGENGTLGRPLTDVQRNNASGIEWIEYEHGFIVGNRAHGYHISMGRIRDKWASDNYEFGPMGFPVSDLLRNNASGIEWQEFENGFIVGNEVHGYYYSMGKIRDAWVSENYEFGPLGFPMSDIIEKGNKKYQQYEYGVIIGNGKVGYHISRGEIRDRWLESGSEYGMLGLPVTNILRNSTSGIEWQEFENGFIVGNSKYGYHLSMGPIRDVWVKNNWEFGPLGFPISDILENDGRKYQLYEYGKIVYSPELGAWVE